MYAEEVDDKKDELWVAQQTMEEIEVCDDTPPWDALNTATLPLAHSGA